MHFSIIRRQPTPPPGYPKGTLALGGRAGVWAGADFIGSKNALRAPIREDVTMVQHPNHAPIRLA